VAAYTGEEIKSRVEWRGQQKGRDYARPDFPHNPISHLAVPMALAAQNRFLGSVNHVTPIAEKEAMVRTETILAIAHLSTGDLKYDQVDPVCNPIGSDACLHFSPPASC
jgi:hypothetical protein